MKKRKNLRPNSRFLSEDKYSPSTYLRLCHRCLFLNESSRYIEKCVRCESDFAEFSSTKTADYKEMDFNTENPVHEAIADFESEHAQRTPRSVRSDDEPEDAQEDSEQEEKPQKRKGTPISGLSVLW